MGEVTLQTQIVPDDGKPCRKCIAFDAFSQLVRDGNESFYYTFKKQTEDVFTVVFSLALKQEIKE